MISDHGFVEVRGASQHNLRGIDVDIPRNAFVVFTGVSGSGKSSLAFGTIYAEAQRRYFDSIAPYTRRLMAQLPAPRVREIRGLPPAVALQQRRGEPTARSSVGTLTRLSHSLRMLFSRAGTYPPGTTERLDSDAFSANTPAGACPDCHGIGIVHTVSESSLVPNPDLTIRERAIASWPGAWQGKNFQDILATLGYDVDKPWKDLAKKDRDWILFTDEKPVVTVHAIREAHRIQRPYQGTYMSAANYVLHTYGTTGSATLRKRAEQFMDKAPCGKCKGKRLQTKSLAVTFAGHDIADLNHMALSQLAKTLSGAGELKGTDKQDSPNAGDSAEVAKLIVEDLLERIGLLSELGLDYLSLDRITPTLSAGELQRLRLATQLKSGLFGVVYVLDEPSAGLHPADCEALLKTLLRLKDAGNSLFVVEHEMDLVRQADWIVDIGPLAGEGGGCLLYSGQINGLASAKESITRQFLFPDTDRRKIKSVCAPRNPSGWLTLSGINRHNLVDLEVKFPRSVLTVVTGVSGSGKTTLVSQVLAESVSLRLGTKTAADEEAGLEEAGAEGDHDGLDENTSGQASAAAATGLAGHEKIKRIFSVHQKPIGLTPRSNLAT